MVAPILPLFGVSNERLDRKIQAITEDYRRFPRRKWEKWGYVRTAEDALRFEIWSAVQKLKDVAELLRPREEDEITVGVFIADFGNQLPSLVNIEKTILNAVPNRAWAVLIEPHADGRPHENLLVRMNRNQLKKLKSKVREMNKKAGFRLCKLSRPSDLTNWSRPGKLPGLVGYSGKNALYSDKIGSFMTWLDQVGGKWIRTSTKLKSGRSPTGFIPDFQHSKNVTESSRLSKQHIPPFEKINDTPPSFPAGFPVFIDQVHHEEISLKLRIKSIQTLIKSTEDEETLLTLKQNLKQIIALKKELYPARPKEIEFGKAFSKKKSAEKLRENESAINDARNLAAAHGRGERDFIAAAGLNPDEARPIFSEPEQRDADINNLFDTINKWDGKNLNRTNINSKQKRISEYEHWEKVASALIVFREIKKTAENELKAIKNDYNKREVIMKGLNEELAMAQKLKDKELLKYVRLNIKSMKGLIIKHDQLRFILDKMPINIQYHCHLTKQIYHLTRYLNQKNWKKLSTAFKLYDFRQDDSRAENAQKRLDGKDNRKVMKHTNTNLRPRHINQEIIEIEDEALKLKNMKKKGG